MAKKIYSQTIIKWAAGLGISGGTLIGLYFLYLAMIGAITILGHSGDMTCAGTIEDPCYAYINFTANEDIFIYPIDYDPWGRSTTFAFDPAVKSWQLQRSWGTGWRDIPLDRPCTGTWCGLSNSKDTRQFSVAFRRGRTYQIRIIGYKNNPTDIVKWAAFDGEIDPIWDGVGVATRSNSHLLISPRTEKLSEVMGMTYIEGKGFSFTGYGETIYLMPYAIYKGREYNVSQLSGVAMSRQFDRYQDKYKFGLNISLPALIKQDVTELGFKVFGSKYILAENGSLYFGDLHNSGVFKIDFDDLRALGFILNITKDRVLITGITNKEFNLDPTVTFSTNSIVGIATTPLTSDTFIIGYCDDTNNDISFQIFQTNGTILVAETDAEINNSACGAHPVSVSAFDSSNFVIGWTGGSAQIKFKIYDSSGANITGDIIAASGVGAPYSVDVATFNSTDFVIGWYDAVLGDTFFQIYNTDTINKTLPITASTQGGASTSVATFNSTDFVIGWYDAASGDITFATYNSGGTLKSGPADADSNVGALGGFVSTTTFNSTNFVIGWYDDTDDDTTFSIYAVNKTYAGGVGNVAGPIDADTTAGSGTYSNIGLSTFNSTDFVFGWYTTNTTRKGIRFATYNYIGTAQVPDTKTSLGSALKFVSIASRNQARNLGFCNENFIITYINSTAKAVWEAYDASGSVWNGVCPPEIAPTVNINLSINNAVFTINTPSFDFNYTDDSLIANCILYLNNTNKANNATTANFTQTILTASATSNGGYNAYINCSDGTNIGQSSVLDITVDAAAPANTCTCPNPAANWHINIADGCNITTTCNNNGYLVSFENGTAGNRVNCSAMIIADNFDFTDAASGTWIETTPNCYLNTT